MKSSNHPKLLPSYGRRKSRALTVSKRKLLQDSLSKYLISTPETGGQELEVRNLVSFFNSVALEIGFGGGEHLVAQAERNPNTVFIGAEVFENGIANLIKNIELKNIKNIRIFNKDVRYLLEKIPDHCLDIIYILFPDPWPKRRHHKRRLIGQGFLYILSRKIKPKGKLLIATDHEDYTEWIKEKLMNQPKFVINGSSIPLDHTPTRYEKKAIKAGKNITYFDISVV